MKYLHSFGLGTGDLDPEFEEGGVGRAPIHVCFMIAL